MFVSRKRCVFAVLAGALLLGTEQAQAQCAAGRQQQPARQQNGGQQQFAMRQQFGMQ
ncbi:MAG: hypothetical protein L0Z62_09920 [Gemmataceae bacterium]|nr:hypothetical protein [Gemmataceae bacterium]